MCPIENELGAEMTEYLGYEKRQLFRRGVKDILIAAVGGLTGFLGAIATIYPKTEEQLKVELCYRQALRIYKRYLSDGDFELIQMDGSFHKKSVHGSQSVCLMN